MRRSHVRRRAGLLGVSTTSSKKPVRSNDPLRRFPSKPVSPWEATGCRLPLSRDGVKPLESSNAAGVFPMIRLAIWSYREVRLQWFPAHFIAQRMPHLTCHVPCRTSPLGGHGVSTVNLVRCPPPLLAGSDLWTTALQSGVAWFDWECPVSNGPTTGRRSSRSTEIATPSHFHPRSAVTRIPASWTGLLQSACLLPASQRPAGRGSCRSHPFQPLA